MSDDIMAMEEEEPFDFASNGQSQHEAEINDQEREFEKLDLEQRWEKVFNLLKDNEKRWDSASEPAGVPVLDNFMKKLLLTGRNTFDDSTPTVLHILAKYRKRRYDGLRTKTLQAIISYLLDHRAAINPHDGAGSDKRTIKTAKPFLQLALMTDDFDFIDCTKACQPETFNRLLTEQDNEGMNILHRIFVLPHQKEFVKNEKGATSLTQHRKNTLTRASRYVSYATPETIAAKDEYGNSPIHYAADFRQCWSRQDDYVDIFRQMVLKADNAMKEVGELNKDNESPILFSERTEKEWKSDRMRNTPASPDPQAGQNQQVKQKQPVGSAPSNTINVKEEIAGQLTTDHIQGEHNKPKDGVKPGAMPEVAMAKIDFAKEAPEGYRLRSSLSGIENSMGPSLGNKPDSSAAMWRVAEHQFKRGAQVKKTADQADTNAKIIRGMPSVDSIRKFLTLHYIRARSDLEARELVYGRKGSDTNLYFDASCLKDKRAKKVTELLNRMSEGFGSVVSYVYLPTIMHTNDGDGDGDGDFTVSQSSQVTPKSYTSRKAQSGSTAKGENPNIGRTCLISVFNKLHEKNVKKIIRLIVDDMEHPSHTDAAIEMCLRGHDSMSRSKDIKSDSREIQVECWDWRKPDLNTDVIVFAAPSVEYVHLYWSGNAMVLRGWASPNGIPRIWTTSKALKKVTIKAAPGLETRERMDKMLNLFKQDVEDKTREGLLDIQHEMAGLFSNPVEAARKSIGRPVEGPRQHEWVTGMEEFVTALKSIHQVFEKAGRAKTEMPERVKVALIDDGVDLGNLDTYQETVKVTGVNYCPPILGSERPWYESSSGHGTVMANMVTRINPWVSLHVIKLQDGHKADGSRTIYAESAANAILAAVQRRVHIISMSWTVKQKIQASDKSRTDQTESENSAEKMSYEDMAIEKLEKAIDGAKKESILMFCSASDDIRAGAMDSLPYRRAGENHIIRIGAALAQGQRDPHSEDTRHIDFCFPGNQVALAINPASTETASYRDGSSVATALAAGLASLIVYCSNIMRYHHKMKNQPDWEKHHLSAEQLARCDVMKKAFRNIDSDVWTEKKYLPVWSVFGDSAGKIIKAEGEKKLEELGYLVKDLCSKVL